MKTQDFIFERMRAAQFYIPIGCNDLTVEINGSCQDVRLEGSRYRDWETDRKSTRLNSSHRSLSRMPSSA